jgi:hypothetical protein
VSGLVTSPCVSSFGSTHIVTILDTSIRVSSKFRSLGVVLKNGISCTWSGHLIIGRDVVLAKCELFRHFAIFG